ncbi:MAG: transglutaminase-like domain-containing protein [Planctomycetota bacterium]
MHRVTLVLAGVSSALVQVVLNERQPGSGLALLVVSVLLAFVIGRFARSRGAGVWSPRVVGAVVALALLPLVWDAVTRVVSRSGAPYEAQLACVLRNAVLALAATPQLPRATGHAALGSFFLVVFGYLWSTGPLAIGLLVVYALVGTWWLLAAYWDRLGGRFADSSESAMPLRPATLAVLALAAAAAALLPLARNASTTTALSGFFPSSGGTQWNDPFAHGGVGDGDQLVGAKDQASSFGPVDTELFLESKMPSLYDAFNEFSQATPVKIKKQRRAIPLGMSQSLENHAKTGTTQRASKEFSTVRQTTPRKHQHDDRLSAALLMVRGRTPLHLAMETYDRWDGRSLIAAESADPIATRLLEADKAGRRWLKLSRSYPSDTFSATARSQVRVINLGSERVPTPAGATNVTLTGLHAASMFDFAGDGSLRMSSQRIPQLTIFEFRAALRDRSSSPALALVTPPKGSGRVGELAAAWAAPYAEGWRQVEAVVDGLQSRCTHDPEAMAPADAEDAVEHFLFDSRRGPDYLFATSAALLLRSLGYDTRVRSGFYASPDRYRSAARLTSVLAEDAHFWVEVRTKRGKRVSETGETLRGVWMTVEPTPGYGVLYVPESWLAWLSRMATESARLVAAKPLESLAWAAAIASAYALRRRLIDGLLLLWWLLRSRTVGVNGLARVTLRLLQWRAWAHRCGRPTGASLGRWDAVRSQNDFLTLVGWALYGSGAPAPLDPATARDACRRALRAPLGGTSPAPSNPNTPPNNDAVNTNA